MEFPIHKQIFLRYSYEFFRMIWHVKFILVEMINVSVAGVPIGLGTGGGCLISGLVFGWLRAKRHTFGNLTTTAALNGVMELAKSSMPVLGNTVSCAISNVLLT